jgi:hypothetical protein
MIAERADWLPDNAREIPLYPGYYVTTDCRLFTSHRCLADGSLREMAQVPDREGYPRVKLIRDGRRSWVKVAKIMAMSFLPPRPSPTHQVRHLDGDNTNNHVSNLAWGTPKENGEDKVRHGTQVKGERHHMTTLTAEDVRVIRWSAERGTSRDVLALEFGQSRVTIGRIIRRVTWGHVA